MSYETHHKLSITAPADNQSFDLFYFLKKNLLWKDSQAKIESKNTETACASLRDAKKLILLKFDLKNLIKNL